MSCGQEDLNTALSAVPGGVMAQWLKLVSLSAGKPTVQVHDPSIV